VGEENLLPLAQYTSGGSSGKKGYDSITNTGTTKEKGERFTCSEEVSLKSFRDKEETGKNFWKNETKTPGKEKNESCLCGQRLRGDRRGGGVGGFGGGLWFGFVKHDPIMESLV